METSKLNPTLILFRGQPTEDKPKDYAYKTTEVTSLMAIRESFCLPQLKF